MDEVRRGDGETIPPPSASTSAAGLASQLEGLPASSSCGPGTGCAAGVPPREDLLAEEEVVEPGGG